MALFLATTARTLRWSLSRQCYSYQTARLLSAQAGGTDFQQSDQQTAKTNYTTNKGKPQRRYAYYLLSIGAGALIGTLYTLRQSQKYEGLMPEYLSNIEILERQAMEARPVPPPVTKHVTFDQPSRVDFPFKVTLYQYVTWFVKKKITFIPFRSNVDVFSLFILVRSVVKCEPI